jgi:hypothetical protein
MSLVPAASGSVDSNLNANTMESNMQYTDDELKELYKEYNINDNDLNFANGKLPYYLEGTVLDSNLRVIASKTGKAPENLVRGKDYDLIISHEEMFAIIDEASKQYMKKYGIDPESPKIDIVNGYALPREEITKLVKSGEVTLENTVSKKEMQNDIAELKSGALSLTRYDTKPYAINGIIDEHIFVATDSRHKPTQAITQATHNGLYRFEDFGIGVNVYWYWNSWDASDISPADSADNGLDDLREDTDWVRNSANDLVIGWAHNMDHNGMAWKGCESTDKPFAICADTATGIDWPHDSIVQHEVSHNFDADDQNSIFHPTCIMNYLHARLGTDIWCTSCENTVNNGIYN